MARTSGNAPTVGTMTRAANGLKGLADVAAATGFSTHKIVQLVRLRKFPAPVSTSPKKWRALDLENWLAGRTFIPAELREVAGPWP